MKTAVSYSDNQNMIRLTGRTQNLRTRTRVMRVIDRLPEQQRTSMLLRYYCGLTLRQTAEEMQMPEWTVANCLRLATEEVLHEMGIVHMDAMNTTDIYDDQFGLLIRQALHRHAQESISDEQIERVLAPIKKMIREGTFDRE